MEQYKTLLKHIMENGDDRMDRTGTGTRSVFGYNMRFNLKDGFPLVTVKKVPFKNVVSELIWFLSGDTNIKFLQDHKNPIWDDWALDNGDLGPVYGKMWRSWPTTSGETIDQIDQLINNLKAKPFSRRHIVSGWNPEMLPDESISPIDNVKAGRQALPPCHTLFQFAVNTKNELSCQLYQRSCDVGLGLSFNIASYSLLTHMLAKECGYEVGEFVWTGGDVHLYHNHIEPMASIMDREPLQLPTLWMNPDVTSIFDYTPDDIKILNYESHPFVKLPIAV